MVKFYLWKEHLNTPEKICNDSVSCSGKRSLFSLNGLVGMNNRCSRMSSEYKYDGQRTEPELSMCKLKLPWDFKLK